MEVDQKRNIPSRDVIGVFCEVYTPAAGRIVSPSLAKKLEYAKFILTQDANVSFKDAQGNAATTIALLKGRHDFLVSEISAVSAGSVLIIHDGIVTRAQD
jgi:hypothetical protein